MSYVYPKFSKYDFGFFRIGGAGLGNLLFIYARALIYARKYQLKMINPVWSTFKLGPLIRNERDKRFYLDLFNAKGITGLKKLYLLFTQSSQSEEDFLHHHMLTVPILVVTGLKNHFDDLRYENDFIKQNLLKTCKPALNRSYQEYNAKTVAVHIRLGDYPVKNRNAIAWYIEKINQVRSLGYNYTAVIFSDGKDEELKPILDLPDTSRVKVPNALADLLRMSKSEVLIGSNSTFTAWAAFLGRNHFIRKDNFYLNKIYHEHDTAYEGSLNGDDDHLFMLKQ